MVCLSLTTLFVIVLSAIIAVNIDFTLALIVLGIYYLYLYYTYITGVIKNPASILNPFKAAKMTIDKENEEKNKNK